MPYLCKYISKFSRLKKENEERDAEDKALHERIDNEMRDREKACQDLEDKLNQAKDDQVRRTD